MLGGAGFLNHEQYETFHTAKAEVSFFGNTFSSGGGSTKNAFQFLRNQHMATI